MSFLASTKPVDPATAAYFFDQIDQARTIYEMLFPTQHLRFILNVGEDPVWSNPEVVEGNYVPRPTDLGADYLGSIVRPGNSSADPEVTVRLSIPRQPNPREMQQTDAPWRPTRGLGLLFRASPLAYEHLRYSVEMLRKRLTARRNTHTALPLGRGTNLIAGPVSPRTDKRPAILIGMHWLEMGGAEKLGLDTIRWALAAGLRVIVVAAVPTIQRLAGRLPDHPDVTFIRLDRYLPHALWPRYVEKLVHAENIRAIHIHHCTPLYESLPMLRVQLPWVQIIDSTHIIEYDGGGYPRVSGVWSSYLDVQHVISGELVDYMRDTFNVSARQVVLGRMLDHDDALTLPPLRLQAGQKMLHVSFVGRLFYQKRPVVVVLALRTLQAWAQKNDVTLTATIVGDGPYNETVAELLRRYDLASQVTLLPGSADIPALLDQSDILLLPSNNEGLALVCYEAVAHGCIPISTRVGSQTEVLPDALLVPLAPRAAVQGIVAAVDAIWQDAAKLAGAKTDLQAAFRRMSTDPTAKEVLMPTYCSLAKGEVA